MIFTEGRLSDEETARWVAFDAIDEVGLGSKSLLLLYEKFQGLYEAWQAPTDELIVRGGLKPEVAAAVSRARAKIDPDELLEKIRKDLVWPYVYADPFFPAGLRHISDPPAVLYCRGIIDDTAFLHSVGIVGTRRCSTYGQKVAKTFAHEFAARGVLVVSGMALGIDSLAHWGAIEGGGNTVAVLGCGPDICYPPSNKKLYDAILEGHGAIVSEYPPGTRPEKFRFPARNRIISGLASALVIVEAPAESGALITAELAWNQSRSVYAVPGKIDSPASVGNHRLIRENKAALVTCVQDVLTDLNWFTAQGARRVPVVVELFGREKEVYELLTNEPQHFDILCHKTGMEAGEMSATLTMLELAGVITRHTGDWYSREMVNLATGKQS
jgi:DNA processing protein